MNGLAQCVLGNHELNLILGKRHQGNRWFEGYASDPKFPELGTCAALPAQCRNPVLAFLGSLPLALEREDLLWYSKLIASPPRRVWRCRVPTRFGPGANSM